MSRNKEMGRLLQPGRSCYGGGQESFLLLTGIPPKLQIFDNLGKIVN